MEPELTYSLIIPAFNEEKYIGACLESALENSKGAFKEIIVVDNASTDRTAEVAVTYPGVRVVYEPQKGTSHARQRGYLASSGDILVFIDADTQPPKGWIEHIRAEFKKDPRVVGVTGPYWYYDLSPQAEKIVSAWNVATKLLSYVIKYIVIGGNFAIRRDVLEKMGGFNESIEFYGDDVDIGQRVKKYGKMVYTSHVTMPSSARHLKAQGFIKTGNLYAKNLLSVVALGRPTTLEHEDFR